MRSLYLTGLALVLSLLSFAPLADFLIQGKITDSNNQPLVGVTIRVKGTSVATLSDAQGNFSLHTSLDKPTLVFQFVGYDPVEKKIRDHKNFVQVRMKPASQKLEEVVVVGYGSNDDSFVQAPSAPTKMLRGAVPGVYTEGSPGAGAYLQRNPGWRNNKNYNREGYDGIVENSFHRASDEPLSTFSIDVDAASYSNVRRFINSGELPPAGAVRIEEMINYFHYDYAQPVGNDPFSIHTEMADCPWNPKHRLVLIGLQGKQINTESLPASNLVFLIDVSGSMDEPEKLPLVKKSLLLLVDQLRPQDRVAIVVYAGNAGLVLPSTSGENKQQIREAIERLEAGGSTAGGAGIRLAYEVARKHFAEGGNNRVILCTDGDFNVGESSDDAMERLIEKERNSGVFLTVLGFGTGNYQDAKMQKLADKGNGNHAYIDNFLEARKLFVQEFGGTLFTIAKDVKLQIEFNPAKVAGYRLIGYENRVLQKEDFNDDKKDAGDLGSGHTVTALYEIIPAGQKSSFLKDVDPLRYQQHAPGRGSAGGELMTVKFRYKAPGGSESKLIVHPVQDISRSLRSTSDNFRFAAAVAEFGMLLRESAFKQQSNYDQVWSLARQALGEDREGYRSEFLRLVRSAASLADGEAGIRHGSKSDAE